MTQRPSPLLRPLVAVAAVLTLVLGVLVTINMSPAQAATTALTGTVTSFDGRVVDGVEVELYENGAEPGEPASWYATQQTWADDDGDYAFTDLAPGTYRIGAASQDLNVYDPDTGDVTTTILAPSFFPAARTVESAGSITVGAGSTSTANITLPEGGKVTGLVTGQPDLPQRDLSVVAEYHDPATGTWGTADFSPVFEEDHDYTLVLQPGAYALRFYDSSGHHYSEYWNDAESRVDAEDVVVTAGDSVGGYDAELAQAGRIEGTLTGEDGAPLDTDDNAYAQVEVLDEASGTWSRLDDVEGGYVDDQGHYGFGPLQSGSYRVAFEADDYPRSYFGGPTAEKAETINLEHSEVRRGIDVRLAKPAEPGAVAGTVQLPTGKAAAGAFVVAYEKLVSGEWREVGDTRTSKSGAYAIGELPAGPYAVKVFPGTPAYAPQVYLGRTTLDDSTPIGVAAGKRTPLKTMKLVTAGSVSGTIVLPSGVTDATARTIDVLERESGDLVSRVIASKRGSGTSWTYSVPGLASGSYTVQFARSSGQSLATGQYFKNVAETRGRSAATAVKVTAGKTTPSVNATLRTGATIKGRVLDADGDPLRCSVLAVSVDGTLTTRAAVSSSSSGAFTIAGLSDGAYKVLVQGDAQRCTADPQSNDETSGYYYDGSDSVAHTTTVTGDANEVTVAAGIPATLPTDLYYGQVDRETFDSVPTPTLSGTAAVGKTLTSASGGDASPTQEGVTIRWYRGAALIDGANEPTYSIAREDAGTQISVRYEYGKDGFVTVASGTEPRSVGAFNVTRPTISGTAAVGKKLTAKPGTWAGSGWSYSYQWYRGSAAIKGATKTSYTVTKSDRKKSVSVRVTARKSGYASATAASAAKRIG